MSLMFNLFKIRNYFDESKEKLVIIIMVCREKKLFYIERLMLDRIEGINKFIIYIFQF